MPRPGWTFCGIHRPARRRDAWFYGLCGVVAGATPFVSSVPVYRQWGWIALGPYLLGAALSALPLPRRHPATRAGVAQTVFVGVVVLPVAIGIAWRSNGPAGTHVQSETLLTEETAKAFVHGRDPYATDYLRGPLAAWPVGTKTHDPYLPAMLLLGLPRAVGGDHPWTDARAAFLAATLVAVGLALRTRHVQRERALLVFQGLILFPLTGVLLSGGGDDVAVAGLMVLAVALLGARRPAGAAIVAALAAAAKQPALALVPFVVLAAVDRDGRPARGRALCASIATFAAVVAPFVLWNPAAFVRDAVLFPVGYGKPKTFHPTPTPGVLLARAFPAERAWVAIAAALTVIGLAAWLAARPPNGAAGAARRGSVVLTAAIVLAPATRIGFLVYPLFLLVWARIVERPTPSKREHGGVRTAVGAGAG